MARPLLKFTLSGARPAATAPDPQAHNHAATNAAPAAPRISPAALEVLPKELVLLNTEDASASRIIAAAAGTGGLIAVLHLDAGKSSTRWWALLDAVAATMAAESDVRPVAALRVVRRVGDRLAPEVLATLRRQLSTAGVQAWPLAAGDEELLVVVRDRLADAATALVAGGHAVGPPARLSQPPESPELEPDEVEKFCGVWRLTCREKPPGTVVERHSRTDGPMRIQAANGVYVEMAVRTPGEAAGQESSCGVLSVAEDSSGQLVLERHASLSFAPPGVGPRRCRVALDAAGGDEGEDVAIESLLGEGSSATPEVERWERVSTGDVTVLELKAVDPRPGGNASNAHTGMWLFCGRHWVRVTGLPHGKGLGPAACCRSFAQAQEIFGEESLTQELQTHFDACCGILERPGFLSVLRRAWSSVGDPVYFDANNSKSRSEVRKEGEVIVHAPADGPTTLWDVKSFATDPFTPVPKRVVKPTAPEGLRSSVQSWVHCSALLPWPALAQGFPFPGSGHSWLMTPPEVTPGRPGSTSGSYYDRISRLSERLSGLQQGLEHERNSRFDQLSQKMNDVDVRLQGFQDTLQHDCGHLKEQLARFQREFDEERLSREALHEAKSKDLDGVDLRLQQALEAEQQTRRDAESKLLRAFDEKTSSLREDLAREGRTRAEAEAALRRYVDVDIPRLQESLREEGQHREAMEERIVRRASDEIARLQDAVLAEKKAREDTEEALLRMLEETVGKMRAEIAQERADREATEETLLKLLEETCNKLNTASQIL